MNANTTEYEYLGSMPLIALKRSMTTDPINWIEVDHLNSPKSVVKLGKMKNGYSDYHNIVWRWETEPYGSYPAQETMKFDYGYGPNNIATTTTFTMNLRFPGQVFDKETGTHYNVFRDYDPQTGRYLQADPIGLGGGMNRWGYVGGNPMNGVDPLGLDEAVLTNPGVTIGLVGVCIANPIPCGAFVAGGACAAGYNYFFKKPKLDPTGPIAGVKPYNPDIEGIKPPGDCNQFDSEQFTRNVESTCKESGTLNCKSAPGNDLGQTEIYSRIAKIQACIRARTHRENTCYDGGDFNHRLEILQYYQTLKHCEGKLKQR